MTHPSIAIIGTGNVGSALGVRLSRSGMRVCFGVRAGKDVSELLARCGDGASSAPVAEAATGADVVFLAVPAKAVVDAATSLGDVAGTIIVDCNNPLTWDGGPVWAPPAAGSLSAAIAEAVPEARVVKGFNTFGAEFHEDPTLSAGAVDVYLASDDAEAKEAVAEVARTCGFSPVDAGPLRNAAVLENLAMLWIHLATVGGHGREFAFKMLGRGASTAPHG